MPTHKNGQKRVITLVIFSISTLANKNGMFTILCEPTQENPTGVYQRTLAQLKQLANQIGLADWSALGFVAAAGDVTVDITEQFCQEGATSPDDPTIVYTKDWWKIDAMDLKLGSASMQAVREIVVAVATKRVETSLHVEENRAQELRRKLRMGIAANADEEPEPELIEEEADLVEEEPTIKAKAKRK